MPKRRKPGSNSSQNVKSTKYEQVTETVNIAYNDKQIAGLLTLPITPPGGQAVAPPSKMTMAPPSGRAVAPPSCRAVILTHGAGGDMFTQQLVYLTEHLASRGYTVLRFTCKGLNITYRTNVYLAVLRYLKSVSQKYQIKQCILGGRSMGSRAAVNVANLIQDDPVLIDFTIGVLCLAYPLHPPKQLHKLRDAPLKLLTTPVLFVSGTEDEMVDKDAMNDVMMTMRGACAVHWLEGIRHSHVPRPCTKDAENIVEMEICNAVTSWIEQL